MTGKFSPQKGLLLAVVFLAALVFAGLAGARLRPASPEAAQAPSSRPASASAERLPLQVQVAGPDDKGLVRGKIRNDTGRYIADARVSLRVLDASGTELPETAFWGFGDLNYYILAPGEEYPFLAFTKGRPGNKIEASASGIESARLPLDLKFLPEPRGGRPILGRLQNNARLIKSYELQALSIYLVPLDEGGLPQSGDSVRGWGLSMGLDSERLNEFTDLDRGRELVLKYNSVLPDDWKATRGVIDGGRYKVVITSWRPTPEFEQTPTGQTLSEKEVRYILGLKGTEAELERMTYRQYLDKYKPGDYHYGIGDATVLYVVTTRGTSLHPRAGQYFNRHRTLLNATTGEVYGSGHWWDSSEGQQPEGPGRLGSKPKN